MTPQDEAALRQAKDELEHPNLWARAAHVFGTPFERGAALLPERARRVVAEATQEAVTRALEVAVSTLDSTPAVPTERLHKALAAATGALGGAFGLWALPIELSASTTLILRSIAEIARHEGEDLSTPAAKLACVEVFALGGFSKEDDAAEVGYYAARAALAKTVADATRFVAEKSFAKEGAPALVRLVSAVAARFGVVVTDKVLLTAVPLVGALSGAALNTVFMDHFQRMARGHFTVRRLERAYGADVVRAAFVPGA